MGDYKWMDDDRIHAKLTCSAHSKMVALFWAFSWDLLRRAYSARYIQSIRPELKGRRDHTKSSSDTPPDRIRLYSNARSLFHLNDSNNHRIIESDGWEFIGPCLTAPLSYYTATIPTAYPIYAVYQNWSPSPWLQPVATILERLRLLRQYGLCYGQDNNNKGSKIHSKRVTDSDSQKLATDSIRKVLGSRNSTGERNCKRVMPSPTSSQSSPSIDLHLPESPETTRTIQGQDDVAKSIRRLLLHPNPGWISSIFTDNTAPANLYSKAQYKRDTVYIVSMTSLISNR